MGAPGIYTPELGLEICEKIATSSKGLHRLCKDNQHFPNPKTIIQWLLEDKYPEFSKQYARAREEQAEFMIEETLEIADDGSNDTITIKKGDTEIDIENKEWTNRSRLRVDTRKWIASKLKPKKYGDKLDITTDGDKITTPVITAIDKDGKVIDGKLK